MADPISRQQLENASTDADDIGLVANGDENTQVSMRQGRVIPSVAKVINDIQSKVNATPGITQFYATRAEGVAHVAVGGYFISAETGTLRTYKVTSTAPFYEDQGDAAAPVSQAALDAAVDKVAATVAGRGRLAIFGVLGQSNCCGRAQPISTTGNVSTGFDTTRSELPDARILTFSSPNRFNLALWNADGANGRYVNKITIAVEPLFHPDGGHGMAHAWTAVRGLLDEGLPAQKALLVPCGVGGTSMSPAPFPATSWGAGTDPANPANPGSDLYEGAIAQMFAAAAEAERLGYDWYFAGIIWHQGEGNQSSTAANFSVLQDTIFVGLRQRLGVSDLLIICGSFIFEIVSPPLFNNAINRQVLIDTARRLPHTSFFYGPGPGYQVDAGDNFAHFNADGQRILGNSAIEAYAIAMANVPGTKPLPVRKVSFKQVGSTINVWWKRPICRVTDYNIQYSTDGGETWTDVAKPAGPIVENNIDCGQYDLPAAQINGISQGAEYQVSVTAINEDGVSDPVVVIIDTVAPPSQVTGLNSGSSDQSTISSFWASADRANSYIAQYSSDGGANWITDKSGILSTSYTFTGLNPLTNYSIRIIATNDAGNGLPSAALPVSTTALNVLDSALSGAAQAKVFGYYSVARRLKDAYTGPLITVRRTSDNTTQDIGQTAAKVLDTAALATFLGASDGYLAKVYDQSGGARDMAQANAANQPRIAIAGSVVSINGRPSADQTMDGLRLLENTTLGLYAAGKASVYAVIRSSGGLMAGESATAATSPVYSPVGVGSSGNTLAHRIFNDAAGAIVSANTATQVPVHDGYHAIGVIDSGSSLVTRQDGSTTETLAYTRSGTFANLARNAVGGIHLGASYSGMTGYWAEIITFTDALSSTDYAAIEANQAAWFGTAKS